MHPIKAYENKSILYVWATPGASKERIGEIVIDQNNQPYLKVYVTVVPEKGLANKAIIQLLSKKFNIPKSMVHLISGETDRKKRFMIDLDPEKVYKLFQEATGSLF